MSVKRAMLFHLCIFLRADKGTYILKHSVEPLLYTCRCASLASLPYFPPCAHARMISRWGEGREKYLPSPHLLIIRACAHGRKYACAHGGKYGWPACESIYTSFFFFETKEKAKAQKGTLYIHIY